MHCMVNQVRITEAMRSSALTAYSCSIYVDRFPEVAGLQNNINSCYNTTNTFSAVFKRAHCVENQMPTGQPQAPNKPSSGDD